MFMPHKVEVTAPAWSGGHGFEANAFFRPVVPAIKQTALTRNLRRFINSFTFTSDTAIDLVAKCLNLRAGHRAVGEYDLIVSLVPPHLRALTVHVVRRLN